MRTRRAVLLVGLGILLFFPQSVSAQWVQTGGPEGGTVYVFAVSGTNLFAGARNGVFLSTNNGATWATVGSGLPDTPVEAFAVSGTNLFAGTWNGVFLSANNGASWTAVNSGLPERPHVQCLAVCGTNVFAGTAGGSGVFLSTNDGASWTPINSGFPVATSVMCLAASGPNLFAGTDNGLFLSTNNGASWTAVNSGLAAGEPLFPGDAPKPYIRRLAVMGTKIFAAANAGVFLSTNNGASWTAVSSGLPAGAYVNCFAVSGANLLAGIWNELPDDEHAGIFRSTDNGKSWAAVNSGLTDRSVLALAASGANLVAGIYDGGVFISKNNGKKWKAANFGLTASAIGHLAVKGLDLFAAGDGKVFLSTDDGARWTTVRSRFTGKSINLVVRGANLFAVVQDLGYRFGVFRSADGGASWTPVNSGLPEEPMCTYFGLFASGPKLFAGTGEGIFLSINNGNSWTAVKSGLRFVSCFAVDEPNLFAGGRGGAFLSTDNGASWAAVNSGLPAETYVKCLAVMGTRTFAGTLSGGVFVTSNNGATWTAVNSGLPLKADSSTAVIDVWDLVVNGTTLFALASTESLHADVFMSSDNGASWAPVKSGLPEASVYCIAIKGMNLYAGTLGRGVWRLPLSELSLKK